MAFWHIGCIRDYNSLYLYRECGEMTTGPVWQQEWGTYCRLECQQFASKGKEETLAFIRSFNEYHTSNA
jgi:hypothetical protein